MRARRDGGDRDYRSNSPRRMRRPQRRTKTFANSASIIGNSASSFADRKTLSRSGPPLSKPRHSRPCGDVLRLHHSIRRM